MGQALRRSQFITTYGPGAILEGPNGPNVIMSLDRSGLFSGSSSALDYQITDQRLSTALLGGAGIVRLPSNAELGVPESQPVYDTSSFPAWALCTKHQTHILYRKRFDAGPARGCPKCAAFPSSGAASQQVRKDAIRFVRVCPEGHLDDVDWIRLIDHTTKPCVPEYLEWKGSGSALKHISVRCPKCKASANLGLAYSRDWPCSGRLPEYGPARSMTCSAKARILQRGAANLRIAELVSALTIPPADTRLHRLLESHMVQSVLALLLITSKQQLIMALRNLAAKTRSGQAIADELDRFDENDILVGIAQMMGGDLPQDRRTLRQQEFSALQRAATKGSPAQPSSTPGGPPQFEVVKNDVRIIRGPGQHDLRITPISRLRVVMVQTGYRRLDPLQGAEVDIGYVDDTGQKWYPGTELFGEGIFIDLAPTSLVNGRHFPFAEETPWYRGWLDPDKFRQTFYGTDEQDFLHPVFVWWHTLAHRLINALSIDSGYSSAAVRERVFIDIDPDTGEAQGGILLFTAQPGGDGTLGGMIALVPQFERVLSTALGTLDSCSNDPLCSDERFRPGRYNGAACYACQLVSETSCEHRNTRLDRMLLLDNLP